MRIKEVGNKTGLSARAIRLYEKRGFLKVKRTENGYRKYGEEEIARLLEIRFFRTLGVSLAELSDYFGGRTSKEELLARHGSLLKKESVENLKKLYLCEGETVYSDLFDEEQQARGGDETVVLGVDVGTTTVSVVVFNANTGKRLETYTVLNGCDLTAEPFARIQDADALYEKVEKIVKKTVSRYPRLQSIGVTGQMHGIVYTNAEGKAVSPLYTWEDKRGEEKTEGGESYSALAYRLCRTPLPTGYGLLTHYYHLLNGKIPAGAVKICTMADYIVMRLTGSTRPLCHATNAASLGLFNLAEGKFDDEALHLIGIDKAVLPKVTGDIVAGCFEGVSVAVAIGDNQAAFLGSVSCDKESVLVNYGTGSQVCLITDTPEKPSVGETRPYIGGKFLWCGAAICGGRAYALLERFFRSYVTDGECATQYERLNALAKKGYEKGVCPTVCTTFSGTRENPEKRGFITGLGVENFTAEALTYGVLRGMAQELFDLYLPLSCEGKMRLIASGNTVRKNPVFRQILSDVFGLKTVVPTQKEEAAFGAGLFALYLTDESAFKESKRQISYEA